MKRKQFQILALLSMLAPSAYALSPGDVAIIGYNTSGSPDSFTIVTMTELAAGTSFFINDNEIATDGGGSFTDLSEGEASFTVKAGQTIPAGTIITLPWGAAAVSTSIYDYSTTSGFGLGNNNEEIHIYEASLITSSTPTTFLFSAKIGSSSSSRPSGLTAGTTFISPTGTTSRYKIAGATYSGTPSELLAAIGNTATNWEAVAPAATTDWTFSVTGAGGPTNTLTLSASPSTFLENATNPASVGTVTRSEVTGSDLVVTISSSDVTEVTVPATVTILANQASATFDVSAVNDDIPDGNQIVNLTATASSSSTGNFNVTVQDDGDTLPPTALQNGDIAFTSFNADRDAIAFVALDTIPAGEVIYFNDNEWNGSAIGAGGAFNTGEGVVTWTAPAGGVAAGTVVVIDNYDKVSISASVGSVTGSSGLSATDESIYAYQGLSSSQPTTFLALVANHPADSIVNTGLTSGTTAIYLTSSADFADYTGARFGQATFADYLPIIGNVTNWTINVDGAGVDVAPSATPFITGTPSVTVGIASTVSVAEGNSGTVQLNFPVTRSIDATGFSIDYAITGGTAASGTDFTPLASGTLTFPANTGPLMQNISVEILGDEIIESNETIIITLSNLVQTSGTTTLTTAVSTGTITNDDTVPNVFPASNSIATSVKGNISLAGAEIPAFDPISKRAFAASGTGIQVVDLTNPASPVFISTIQPSTLISGLVGNDISSVAVRKGSGGNPSILAAAIINAPKSANGFVVFLNAATGALLGSTEVGAVPDHIAFTPDGTKLLVCNEGELDGTAVNISTETVPGTVSIINITNIAAPTVQTAGFASFNAQSAALKAAGVRIFEGGIPEFDFEPEYLAISPDGTKAMVTLQEANAVAILDIASATFTSVVPLGEKNFINGRHDFSDRDAAGGSSGLVNPTTGNPVFGLYMPDAIASYSVGGQTYYITANEGDDRNDFIEPNETTTVSAAGYVLDPTVFPDAATLKTNPRLGRLVVSNAPGLRGDIDNDGDIDRILSYGGRSFSILDANGAQVFDSGDMIEMIVASQFPALLDDTRSDNKGPEPEGVTVAKIGARTFAFIGLERSHMTLAFDVTNPLAPTYATAFQRTGDFNPEGMVVIEAADSPTGKPLLLVASEVSNTLTVFEINQAVDFKLQLLHLADAEAGLLASQTAPNLAALVDAFDGTYPNTLILAGGDNFIPGPFLAGGTDISVRDELNTLTGSTISMATSTNHPIAAVDIAIHNILGVEASTIGNHEFDLGTRVFSDAIRSGSVAGWVGANFPYLSANLEFTADADLSGRYTNTLSGNSTSLVAEASTLKGRIAPSAVITKGGQKIGLVAATTQILESISSVGGVEVKGFTGDGLEMNDMTLLASQLQPAIDELKSEGVNKIILMAHLQQITLEQQLAPLLNGVDIILAAGSNTRLGDSNDVAAAFTGHTADFAGNYPIYTTGSDGLPTVIVNTDNEFTYLGRLVADFDADGVLIVPNLMANIVENGAYAATDANVAAAWNTIVGNLPTTAFAAGTKGAQVKSLTDAVQSVINSKDGDIRGYTDVYLEGERNIIRNQSTNLGDITADSLIAAAKPSLPSVTHIAAFKNGGGIRSSIGAVEVGSGLKTPPIANPSANKPAGAISLLDIENSLRFNNGIMLCETTPTGLKAIIEHGIANAGTSNGRFPQIGGIRFSYDPTLSAGGRVRSIVLVDENDNITGRVVANGVIRSDAPATITVVTMNFIANGGDGYPFKANADNFRYVLNNGTLSSVVDESLDFTNATNVPSNILGEQLALSNYLQARYATPVTAFDIADTTPAFDIRIQSTAVRSDSVLAGPATFGAWLALNGYSSTGIDTDTDNDGVIDSLEFFFNQNPNNGADQENLPKLVPNGNALAMQLAFNNQTTLSGALQVSSDLTTWDTGLLGVDFSVASSVVNGDETTVNYALLGSGPSAAGTSATYATPNSADPAGASLGGVRVINHGLVGVGRLSGNALDQFGETQGAASGLFISNWAWNGNQFTGTFNVLPDRGYNSGTIFSNYAARLHDVNFTFSPYYGTTPVAQGQIVPTYASSTKFTYMDGEKVKFTTGLDVTATGSLFGESVGVATAANGPGGAQESLLSFDAEAVYLFSDGSGYVSDEYGTYIARFNSAKRITGITQLPESARPHSPFGTSNFSSTITPTNGRRQNQGLEGMSVTPDGTRLFAVMQSALVQDTNGTNQQTRNNTRLFVYDVAGANRENPVLIGQYVVKLPQFHSTGSGAAVNRTAAQSEIIALNGTSFLMLPRDGNGLGTGTTSPIVFKSVQLVDFATATNILGMYDAEGAAVSPAGVLRPEVKAAASMEVINMLEPTDLAKFGLNKNTNPSNANTLNEKMEGMALVPDLSTPAANDFFLFIANDNDFQSSDVKMIDASGALVSYGDGRLNAGLTNDAMFYAYRITIDASGKRFFRFEVK